MKQLFLSILLILLPLILFEALLYNNKVFWYVIRNTYPTEWSAGFIKPNYWPHTIIMGSSLVRGAIDDDLLEKELSKKGMPVEIGNISMPSNIPSHDYFHLERILKTCKQCPKRILLGVFDVAMKAQEQKGVVTKARIYQNYLYTYDNDKVLDQAAAIDPTYKDYQKSLNKSKIIRTYFLRDKIVFLLKSTLYSVITNQSIHKETIVKTQNTADPGYGYWPYDQKLSEQNPQNSLNNYREYLGNYTIGGSGGYFLDQVVRLAKRNNIEVVIILTPLTQLYQETFAKEVQMFETYMVNYGQANGVRVINAIDFLPYDYSKYTDTNHLNKYGAQDFTKYLAEILASKENQPHIITQ